jgi:hypothetical protein
MVNNRFTIEPSFYFKVVRSPLGIHFFCVAKRNRIKEKATLIALLPKTKLYGGREQ